MYVLLLLTDHPISTTAAIGRMGIRLYSYLRYATHSCMYSGVNTAERVERPEYITYYLMTADMAVHQIRF